MVLKQFVSSGRRNGEAALGRRAGAASRLLPAAGGLACAAGQSIPGTNTTLAHVSTPSSKKINQTFTVQCNDRVTCVVRQLPLTLHPIDRSISQLGALVEAEK